jgi:DNA repair protein RAD7
LQEQNISAAEIQRRYVQHQRQMRRNRRGNRRWNRYEHRRPEIILVYEDEIEDAQDQDEDAENQDDAAQAEQSTAEIKNSAESLLEEAQNMISQEVAAAQSASTNVIAGSSETAEVAETSDDPVAPGSKKKKTKKRRRGATPDNEDYGPANPTPRVKISRRNFQGFDEASDSDSDEEFQGVLFNEENNETLFREAQAGVGRVPGQFDFCASCHCKFTVTLMSETAPDELQTDLQNPYLLLCPSCSKARREKGKQESKGDALATARMQRRRVAAALLDRKEISVPSLLDTCVALVTKHIDDVETLGDIGAKNSERLARILSRNRCLNPKSMRLFLDPSLKKLEFWDCSEIDSESLRLIPAYCPNLEELTLGMCGQLTNDVLRYCATNLTKLKAVYFDGPFLVTSAAWIDFFLAMAGRLERVEIRNTHRFDSEALAVLIEACPQLTHLSLHRMSGLTDPAAYLMLPMLSNLIHLDLSHPPQELVMGSEISLITDETMTVILNSIGSQLETLVLDGCSELTDQFITNALMPCCCGSRLSKLSLAELDQITDTAVANMFRTWNKRHGPEHTRLSSVTLDRCFSLGDAALNAMFVYVRPTLVTLSISTLPDVTSAPFQRHLVDAPNLAQFPYLSSVNISFVRALTNSLIEGLAARAPNLEFIEAFGVPKVNRACKVRGGVKIIGRQDEL